MLRHPFLPIIVIALLALPVSGQDKKTPFELTKGDRVAWVGSSSTNIGVWPKTMEFLLRTRHPEVQLSFKKFSTGGGTFGTGVQNLDKWLADFNPTVVVFNYGSNDAGAGEKGLPALKENIVKCVAKAEAAKARVFFTTFQGADVRKAGEDAAARRKLYAEAQLAFCREKGWPIVDVFPRIQHLQDAAQKDDDKYTILRDKIHLTDPAYIGWGYYLYAGLEMKGGQSDLTVNINNGKNAEVGCKLIGDVKMRDKVGGAISFTRQDFVLPILPPGVLPPRKYVPLELQSYYGLRVIGLKAGNYEIHCQGKSLGATTADALSKGINLNTLVLDSGVTPPWDALARQIWAGKSLDQIGNTQWQWQVISRP